VVEEIKIDSKEEVEEKEVVIDSQNNTQEEEEENNDNKEMEGPEITISTEKVKEPSNHKKKEKKNFENKEDDNEEVSIDFKELKHKTIKFFKGLKTDKTPGPNNLKEPKNKDEEISFDFKKVSSFAKKNSKWLIPVGLILIAIIFSTYFRIMPAELPVTDQWAENAVNNFYQQQISSQINQQYPNLPEQNKQSLINKEWQKQLKQNKDQIDYDIKQLSNQYKDNLQYKDSEGDSYTYLLAIDPYLWYGHGENYLECKNPGCNEVNGKYQTLRNGRVGTPDKMNPLSYFGLFIYWVANLFTEYPLMQAFFLIPVFIIGLSTIPTFLITRKVAGNAGGFFAAMIIAINGALLSRTPAGFSDTDSFNIFFPLLITWLFIEAIDAKNFKTSTIYSLFAALSILIFDMIWSSWFIFGFLIGSLCIYIIFKIIKNYSSKNFKEVKLLVYKGTIFVTSSFVFSAVLGDFRLIKQLFAEPLAFITLKDVAVGTIWPNVLTTVAEFNAVPFIEIINQMGGKVLFFIAILGLILPLLSRGKLEKNIKYSIIIIVWFLATSYAFTKGVRFAILMVPAFAIAFGIGIGTIHKYVSLWTSKHLRLDRNISTILISIIAIMIILPNIISANAIGMSEIPSYNDGWENTLNKIKDDAGNKTGYITTWWDFGHWFVAKNISVTFDGGNQDRRIHWVGKSLLTSDEKESVAIIKMLNCGQEEAVSYLEKILNDDFDAVMTIKEIILLDKEKARKKLTQLGLNENQNKQLLQYTHCENLMPQYYITSEDMVSKSGVWGHFGAWDFKKASMYQIVTKNKEKGKETIKNKFDLSEETADEYYYQILNNPADQWVSTWPTYSSGINNCQKESEKEIICTGSVQGGGIEFTVNLDTMDVAMANNPNVKPTSIVYTTKLGIEEKKFNNGTDTGFSIILIPKEEDYQFVLSNPLQAKSVFTQLFFLEGYGLECFNKIEDITSFNNQRIISWKVDFDCLS
jgi:dolichyl-phosphooligosaccharide-protein glycotransferase